MPDVTLWADEIKAALPEVRRWLEQEAIRNFCLLGRVYRHDHARRLGNEKRG